MGRKQKEKTYIKSIRVNQDTKEFLESLENANLFVLQLLEDTNEFKKFVSNKKSDSMTGNLFENEGIKMMRMYLRLAKRG